VRNQVRKEIGLSLPKNGASFLEKALGSTKKYETVLLKLKMQRGRFVRKASIESVEDNRIRGNQEAIVQMEERSCSIIFTR